MIKIINEVFCIADKSDIKDIKPLLKYDFLYGRKKFDPVKKSQRVEIKQSVGHYMNKDGSFLAGFLPKIQKTLPNIEVKGELNRLQPTKKPHLKGIKPREDQTFLIDQALKIQRGVLLSPTGSGKTIVILLFLSCFPKAKILFLCHSLSILKQTKGEFEKFDFKNIQLLGGGNKKFNNKARITLSTVQTFIKIDYQKYSNLFDIIIIDEAHHLNKDDCQCAKVVRQLFAPVRIGLTATLPNTKEGQLCLEGYLGPVIGEVTIKDSVDKNVLAKPIVKLIPIPISPNVIQHYKYKDVRQFGIVQNRARNRILLAEAKNQVDKNKTVLIMIKEIKHGDILKKMAKELFGFDISFVQGKTEIETRSLIQQTLDKKIIKCVVCTSVWREGINIKSLDTVILALGGKSAIQTAQALGRGLRADIGKDYVLLIDFLDQARYLSRHAIARISLYVENGWLSNG